MGTPGTETLLWAEIRPIKLYYQTLPNGRVYVTRNQWVAGEGATEFDCLFAWSGIDNRDFGPANSAQPRRVSIPEGYLSTGVATDNSNSWGVCFAREFPWQGLDCLDSGGGWAVFGKKGGDV